LRDLKQDVLNGSHIALSGEIVDLVRNVNVPQGNFRRDPTLCLVFQRPPSWKAQRGRIWALWPPQHQAKNEGDNYNYEDLLRWSAELKAKVAGQAEQSYDDGYRKEGSENPARLRISGHLWTAKRKAER